MGDANKYFAIRRLATSAVFVAIIAPIECSQVVIENGDAVNPQSVRTDKDSGVTEKTIPASLELTIRSNQPSSFQQGDIVCYVAAAAGAGPVIVSFTR